MKKSFVFYDVANKAIESITWIARNQKSTTLTEQSEIFLNLAHVVNFHRASDVKICFETQETKYYVQFFNAGDCREEIDKIISSGIVL